MSDERPPVCDYEGSDYQRTFWDQGNRAYEDQVEAVALRRLLPSKGKLLLEIGAGAGRNTPRYQGFERVVLLDYSLSQLRLAQERLGGKGRYVFVAADAYRLPFSPGLFDAATMVRTLHHMAQPALALSQLRRVLQSGAIFILEFANKQNLKAILRYLARRQSWNPFDREAIEFTHLNFDFHPKAVRQWLEEGGFHIERQLTVSHFRSQTLKRIVPLRWLVGLDSLAQWSGDWWQLAPSVFVRAGAVGDTPPAPAGAFFCCPECGESSLQEEPAALTCPACRRRWAILDGIYDFRQAESAPEYFSTTQK
jgi:ubiquinone/menaquinone biosynthesis C-methylase UbiE